MDKLYNHFFYYLKHDWIEANNLSKMHEPEKNSKSVAANELRRFTSLQ